MAILDTYRQHVNRLGWTLAYIVEHSQLADAQFPGRNGIWPKWLPIASLSQRLARELGFDRRQHRVPLTRGQGLEMYLDGFGKLDLIRHAN